MYLTPKQVNELLELIDVNHLSFATHRISDKYLTTQEKKRLEKFGISTKNVHPTVDDAFKYGMLSEALGDDSKHLTYSQIKSKLRSKSFLPLSFRETKVLDQVRYQAYHEIKGLGNRISADVNRYLIESDKYRGTKEGKLMAKQRKKYEDIIQDAATQTVLDRESVGYMASLIGHKTQDWARDLDRISDFVLHNAHDTGRAMQIKKSHGEDAMVYKHVFDQACKTCVRLYLTKGMGSQPTVFKINDLISNGTNIGRKQADWKPVIGSTHPWCRCEMESLPKGEFKWNDESKEFDMVMNEREKEIYSQLSWKIELD